MDVRHDQAGELDEYGNDIRNYTRVQIMIRAVDHRNAISCTRCFTVFSGSSRITNFIRHMRNDLRCEVAPRSVQQAR